MITTRARNERVGLPGPVQLVLLGPMLDHDICRPGITEKTRKNERTYRADLCRIIGPNMVVSCITYDMLIEFQRTRERDGVSPNKALAYLAMATRRAVRSGRLKCLPCPWPRALPSREKIRHVLTTEQVGAVASMMAEPHRQACLLLYLLGGARPGELARMKAEDFDTASRLATLHGTKRGAGLSAKSRQVPISESALAVFQSLPEISRIRGRLLFPHLTRSNVFRDALAEAGEHAEIPFRVTPYTLRYSAATNMDTDDLGTVRKALGHSTIKLTADIYRQTPDAKLRLAIDSLGIEIPATMGNNSDKQSRAQMRRALYRERFAQIANSRRSVQAAIEWLLDVASGVQDEKRERATDGE